MICRVSLRKYTIERTISRARSGGNIFVRRALTTMRLAKPEGLEFNNDPNDGKPIRVPGFGGCPLDFDMSMLDNVQFSHGANYWRQDPRLTARELAMLRVMDALTDKPDWHGKVKNPEIISKWHAEAMAMPLMSEQTWAWITEEMRDKAGFYEQHGYATTLESGSPCAKSDTLVSRELHSELQTRIQPLLQAKDKDWHPGSGEKVLNVCHPSLFPLVYGRTRVLEDQLVGLADCFSHYGKGTIAPIQSSIDHSGTRESGGHRRWGRENDLRFSGKYQWLPTDVKFREDAGTQVQITSYINNLHPVHQRPLYDTIEKFISLAIPMWNSVLVKTYQGRFPPRIKLAGVDFEPREHVDFPNSVYDAVENGDEASLQKVREYLALPDDPDFDTSEDDDQDDDFLNDTWVQNNRDVGEAIEWKFNRLRHIYHPEPGIGYSYQQWKAGEGTGDFRGLWSSDLHNTIETKDNPKGSRFIRKDLHHEYEDIQLERDFREDGLQVIVKLSSIELTPDKPKYEGGSWHIEGLRNERIVGTAIYYYDVDNVTASHIRFRQEAELDSMDFYYEQDDFRPLETVFAAPSLRQGNAIQEVGSVATPQGRMLAFPNTLQHCVTPFELADKSRPGHRRMLVLWLVDPHYRILSTANVPPQQHEWWAAQTLNPVLGSKDIPPELADEIASYAAGYPMSLEEAKRYRLELMEERSSNKETVDRNVSTYNFCEH